jgi:hypothetical protein
MADMDSQTPPTSSLDFARQSGQTRLSVAGFERQVMRLRRSQFPDIAVRYGRAVAQAWQAAGWAVLVAWGLLGWVVGASLTPAHLIWIGTLVGGATGFMTHAYVLRGVQLEADAWVSDNLPLINELIPILAHWARSDESLAQAVGPGTATRLAATAGIRVRSLPHGEDLLRGLVALERRVRTPRGRMELRRGLVGACRAF